MSTCINGHAGTLINTINFKPEINEKIYKLNDHDNSDVIAKCVKILQRGGIIATPTDTLYGVACLAQCSEAVERLYALKERHAMKPVAICVGETYDVCQWTRFPQGLISSVSKKLNTEIEKSNNILQEFLNDFLPGAVTIIAERAPALNNNLNPKISSVGIRVPDNDFICDLANQLREPLALTSANLSGEEPSLCVEDFRILWPKLDAIVDGGVVCSKHVNKDIKYTKEGSTIFKIMPDGESFKIIRAGCVYESTVRKLQDKWGLKLTL